MATRPILCPPIPPNGWVFFKNQFVLVEEYTGNTENNNGAILKINLADVVYAINSQLPLTFDSLKQELSFFEIGNIL